jgi:hypothetical protein
MLPGLLDQIPPEQEIATVTADGAFDTRKCHDAIAARGTAAFGPALEPVAGLPSLPPRKNAKPWKPDTAGAFDSILEPLADAAAPRNEIPRTSKRVGRTIWRRWSGYHRRSRAETEMHCVKLLGQRLSARDFDRQVAEFQVRVAVLNGFTALGTPITEATGYVCPGRGELRPSADLCNRAPALRQISATGVPSSPCLMMNAFCASEKLRAFLRFRSSPSQESVAENSSFKRSSFRGSDHRGPFSGPWQQVTMLSAAEGTLRVGNGE